MGKHNVRVMVELHMQFGPQQMVSMNIAIFRDVMPHDLVEIY
jgi:hypothetical protein